MITHTYVVTYCRQTSSLADTHVQSVWSVMAHPHVVDCHYSVFEATGSACSFAVIAWSFVAAASIAAAAACRWSGLTPAG